MEKIRILFVIDHLDGGGAERQFLNLVNTIDRGKFEVHVFISERRGKCFTELSEHIKVSGLIDSNRRMTLRAILLLRKTILALQPQVVQTWLEYSTFLSALALKTIQKRPLFIASHRTSTEELYNDEVSFGRLKKVLLIWAYKQAGTVTTNSRYLMLQLKDYGLKKIRVIYNGIDLAKFAKLLQKDELREKFGLHPSTFYVSFVGSLVSRKGLEYLIEAVRELKRDDICLLIIGDGVLRKKVERLISAEKRFVLLGYKRNAVEYIKASDLLVLPSTYEGLPNAILEAMAVGTPVVATNIYGIPELIEDTVNGLLVSPRDIGGLARSVTAMIDSPDTVKKFTEISRDRIMFFAIHRMKKEYEDLYMAMCSGMPI